MTVHYTQEDGAVIPKRVHTVVISAQHDDDVSLEEQKRVLKEKVIEAVVPARYLDENTVYHLQPSGRFVIGGPQVTTCPRPAEATEASFEPHMETSLLYVVAHFPAKSKKVLFTKKNTMVILSGRRWSDRQEDHRGHIRRMGGPRGRSLLREGLHQGGPLGRLRRPLGGEVSGESQTVQEGAGAGDITQSIKYKDQMFSSVSGPQRFTVSPCLQVAYAIGVAHPLSISLFTYGSSQRTDKELLQIVNKNFDLRPGVIVRSAHLTTSTLCNLIYL